MEIIVIYFFVMITNFVYDCQSKYVFVEEPVSYIVYSKFYLYPTYYKWNTALFFIFYLLRRMLLKYCLFQR
jgi:hypothetical protein